METFEAEDSGAAVTLTRGVDIPDRQTYSVVSEAGLFKNGRQYDQGESIELDEQTARNFLNSGDIE